MISSSAIDHLLSILINRIELVDPIDCAIYNACAIFHLLWLKTILIF